MKLWHWLLTYIESKVDQDVELITGKIHEDTQKDMCFRGQVIISISDPCDFDSEPKTDQDVEFITDTWHMKLEKDTWKGIHGRGKVSLWHRETDGWTDIQAMLRNKR